MIPFISVIQLRTVLFSKRNLYFFSESRSAFSTFFRSLISLNTTWIIFFFWVGILVSSTSAGKASPLIRWCNHSKRLLPWSIALAMSSSSLSREKRPSGCFSGEMSAGRRLNNCFLSEQPNIFTAAGLQSMKTYPSNKSMASSECSNSNLNVLSFPSFFIMYL